MPVPFRKDMLNLVHKISGQWHRKYPELDYDDIFQEGSIGLIEGIRRADDTPTWKTYVSYRIKFRISTYVRNQKAEMRDFRKTIPASSLADDYDWFDRNHEAEELDLDIPTLRKTIMYILPPKLRDTYKQYYILGRTSDDIGKERGAATGQGVLQQAWEIKDIVRRYFSLTNETITEILRKQRLKGNTYKKLADEYGLTQNSICLLRKNGGSKRFETLSGNRKRNGRGNRFLDMETINKIKEEYKPFVFGCRMVAKKYNITKTMVHFIVTNQIHAGY